FFPSLLLALLLMAASSSYPTRSSDRARIAATQFSTTFRTLPELVEAAAEMIQQRWQPQPAPTWVTCVPSRNHAELVPDFALRLATRLKLPFVTAVTKVRDNEQQKLQQNRYHRCHNLDGVFSVTGDIPNGPVLLVDDIVDSSWTMTVVAALLRRAGSGPVWPLALASTSGQD
ncbi:MAG: ComF family protein, partial [Candidatus Binataceae bacterium]